MGESYKWTKRRVALRASKECIAFRDIRKIFDGVPRNMGHLGQQEYEFKTAAIEIFYEKKETNNGM